MPHLKIRGIEKKLIVEHSKEIVDELTKIIECDRTWFTLEHQETEYIFDGKIVDGYTFIEIYWFPRTEEVKKQVAMYLTQKIKDIKEKINSCIIFFELSGNNYCDNGEFF